MTHSINLMNINYSMKLADMNKIEKKSSNYPYSITVRPPRKENVITGKKCKNFLDNY